MHITPDQWTEALKSVLKKAAVDADFRATCLRNPVAAIKEASGLQIPAEAKIRFVERIEEQVILLPMLGADPDEISAEQALESVAGGKNVDLAVLTRLYGSEAVQPPWVKPEPRF